MKPLFAALRFLTIFPVPERWCSPANELRHAVPFFPVVGLLLGTVAACLALDLAWLLPPLPAAALLTLALAAVSGGLHLDGLADTADAFFSSRPREKQLEIMRDSRTGPMGVIAIAAALGLKFSLFASLSGGPLLAAAFLAPVAGRAAMVVVIGSLPYARPGGGLGQVFFIQPRARNTAGAALVLAVAGGLAAGGAGLAAAGAALILTALLALYSRRKLGGATGDTLGATCEVVEIVPPLTLAVLMHLGWLA